MAPENQTPTIRPIDCVARRAMERILSGRFAGRKFTGRRLLPAGNRRLKLSKLTFAPIRNLTPETASALSELFRVAYTQFSKSTGQKSSKKRR